MNPTPTQRSILKLTALWRQYLNEIGHYKSRDPIWTIEIEYDGKGHPTYSAIHYGYIGKEEYLSTNHSSLAGAEKYLLIFLIDAFEREVHWARKVLAEPREWDDWQTGAAVFAIEEMLPAVEAVRK